MGVTVAAGAVKDVEGNAYAGLAAGYTISTAPLMRFAQLAPPVASGLTAGAFWGFGTSSSVTTVGADGKRFGHAVTVAPDNTIHVVGGRNATILASSTAVLNDVWSLSTKRNINCAASYTEKDPASCASKCSSNTAMGSATTQMTVWRVPSAAGLACKGSDGLPVSTLWGSAASKSETCDCPMCLDPPADPLPTNMVNTSYVSSYGLVTANSGKQPMLCRAGFGPSDDFTCVVKSGSVYFGEYAAYPTCDPLPCSTVPPTITNAAPMTTCQNIASNNTLAHNGTCAVQCTAGYQPQTGVGTGKYTCLYGTNSGFDSEPDGTPDPTHVLPKCVKQVCQNKPVVTGGNTDDCSEAGDILDTVCDVKCDPGYTLVGAATMTCAVPTGVTTAETAPAFSTPGECVPKTCGETPTGLDASVVLENDKKNDGFTGKLGDTIGAKCKAGYTVSLGEGGKAQVICAAADAKAEGDVKWQADGFKCAPVQCPALAAPPNGQFKCTAPTADGKATDFEATCSLVCNAGYAVSGSPVYKCDATEQFTGTGTCKEQTCASPSMGSNMKGTSCGSDPVNEGTTCNVECNDGYVATGKFTCQGGAYVTDGACVKEGVKVVVDYYVQSDVVLTIGLPEGKTLEDVANDEDFKKSVAESIAAALDGIDADKITILSIRAVGRRLEDANARRLGSGKLKVDYKIKVASKSDATKLTNTIKNDKANFEKEFAEALTEKSADMGITVESVEASDPTVIEDINEEATAQAASDAASEDSEDGGNGAMIGGIVGGIAGVGLLGFCFYMYSKKNSSQE